MEYLDRKVGKYTIVSKIGDGGMAEVYMGRVQGEGSFERVVAIKKILPNLARNDKFRGNFINEASICAKLQHHNIVEVYDFIQDGIDLYLVMEYIDGLPLEDVFAYQRQVDQQITTDIIFAVLLQLLEGLEYAHSAIDPLTDKPLNVIHRDLKPSNILVDEKGVVKIVDFGVAKAADRRYVTQELTAKGSPSYMSPDQILGDGDLTQAADVFSVGAIFYELLTLNRLFDGPNVFAILKQVASLDIEKHLNETITGADRRCLPVLRKALAREPSSRYANAGEMLRETRALYTSEWNPRRLADRLRKIRNLDENMEDAATRLVTNADEILKQYDNIEPRHEDDQEAQATQYIGPVDEPVEDKTIESEVGVTDTFAAPDPDVPIAHDFAISTDGASAGVPPSTSTAEQEPVRQSPPPPPRPQKVGERPGLDTQRKTTPSAVARTPHPEPASAPVRISRPGTPMPSILDGYEAWRPDRNEQGPASESPPVASNERNEQPPVPVNIQPFREAQTSNLTPILFGASIGLIILILLYFI